MRPSYRPGISAKRGITMASPRCCLPSKEFFLRVCLESPAGTLRWQDSVTRRGSFCPDLLTTAFSRPCRHSEEGSVDPFDGLFGQTLSALAEVKQLPRNIIEVDRIVIDILSSGD
jgi:hypothetical protein